MTSNNPQPRLPVFRFARKPRLFMRVGKLCIFRTAGNSHYGRLPGVLARYFSLGRVTFGWTHER